MRTAKLEWDYPPRCYLVYTDNKKDNPLPPVFRKRYERIMEEFDELQSELGDMFRERR